MSPVGLLDGRLAVFDGALGCLSLEIVHDRTPLPSTTRERRCCCILRKLCLRARSRNASGHPTV